MGSLGLRGVGKHFGGVKVLEGIDLEVRDGEFLVLVGPSGCGKTTLLRMIAGLESIDSGELTIDGRRANEVHPADRGAAMVFQSYALYPQMTVAQNMGFALRMAGVPAAERSDQVRQAARALHITELLDRLPRDLSGGQRQRVAIGRAIVRKPRVFLFDEPLSNLDAALRSGTRVELARLHRELGATMIYVTHDQVEAMTLGQRIAVFDRGRIVQVGPPLELYRQPASEFVAGFLGTPRLNLIDRPGPAAAAAHRQLWDELGGAGHAHAQRLGVRPEHLRLAEPGSGVPCTLQAAEQLGESAILHLEVQGLADPLRLRAPSSAGESPVGCAMAMAAQRQQVLAFDAEGRRLDPCSARPEEGTP